MVARLLQWLDRSQLLKEQDEEIDELRREIESLRSQNERMRGSMRRCITCDYRAEVNAAR